MTKEEIRNMDKLYLENKTRFVEYALRDSLITLTHANWMEMFNFSIGGLGVPLTLSSIGTKYVLNKWESENYDGYQINPEILIGDAGKIQTPVGLNEIGFNGELGVNLDFYIKNYKGGRNESLMYGSDKNSYFYDLDLTSAYTTVLYNIGSPDYQKSKKLDIVEFNKIMENKKNRDKILNSFIIIKCAFEFPENVKYPSIPVSVDKTTTVYPLKGEAVLTGAEYLTPIF